jgi:acyl-CoA synthetase (AMP-forming)/AMP-acid ligase II
MEEDIIRFCRKRVAHLKSPKSVGLNSALPKSPQVKFLIKRVAKNIFERS